MTHPANELIAKAKLDIRSGTIHYRLYQQDGAMQPMTCKDTTDNRLYVSWMQAHDRYTVGDDQRGSLPLAASKP